MLMDQPIPSYVGQGAPIGNVGIWKTGVLSLKPDGGKRSEISSIIFRQMFPI